MPAAIRTSAKIKGTKTLMVKIGKLPEAEEEMAFQEIVAAANRVLTRAQQTAPYEEGDLVRSLNVIEDREDVAANTGSPLFYAPMVHHGTKRSRANPFLFNAFEAESPSLLRRIEERQDEVVRKVASTPGDA